MTKIPPPPITRRHDGTIKHTDAFMQWFVDVYPHFENKTIKRATGMATSTIYRMAWQLNISKSAEVRNKQRRRSLVKARRVCVETNACRNNRPSAACIEATRRYSAEHGVPSERIRSKDPKKYEQMKLKQVASRNVRFKVKRLMKQYGLNVKNDGNCPAYSYTEKQKAIRRNILTAGYIVGDCREELGERYTIYFDAHTKRSTRRESFAIAHGFKFMPLPQD